MTSSLDLILLPLYRAGGRDMAEMPGLHATQAPRRSARGRSGDTLVIHLALEGTAPLSPKGYQKLQAHLVETYFKTPGSATSAMRTVVEWLNEYLIERNRRGAPRGMKSIGLLTLAVLRGGNLYLAQCGLTHTYLIASQGLSHFRDAEAAEGGLGLARTANIRFRQISVAPQDILLITADPPPIWTTAVLNGLRGLSTDQSHLRLIDRVGPELQAALIQLDTGSGGLRVLHPKLNRDLPATLKVDSRPRGEILYPQDAAILEARRSSGEPASHKAVVPTEQVVPTVQGAHTEKGVHTEKVSEPVLQPLGTPPDASSETAVFASDPRPPVSSLPQVSTAPQQVTKEPVKKFRKPPKVKQPRERVLRPALLRIGQAVRETLKQGTKAAAQMLKRMLPDETMFSIPTSVMAFIAIAVPIVVVALAATVYFQRGRGSMYAEHYLQAQYAAEQAIQLSEPAALREAWNIVLGHLDDAESFQVTEDSQSMRAYAQTILDNLDYVVRLPFQPALADALPSDVRISRIVPSEGDSVLYLLNETDGHVFQAVLTDQGYRLDPDFICEPVPKPLIVGPLVDIIPLPLEDDNNASVMGMDSNGNLLKCISGGKPPLAFQLRAPDMYWGAPRAIESTSLGYYVLDPVTNAVWIFWGTDNLSEQPTLFFDETVPYMRDVIDLTLNQDKLYLLHEDGHLTTCTFRYPTRCEDPAMLMNLPAGLGNTATVDNAIFSEIQFSPPPDPSLFLLEPGTPSIYLFGARLTYQRQYRSQNPLSEGPATAFAVSPSHQIFLAIGNQVYVSPLP